jgi:hypothetical protein
VVAVQNALGKTIKSSALVTLTITTQSGAALSCASNPVTAVSGIAQFSGCQIDRAGSYTLTATSPGLASATSTSVIVSVGNPVRLAFTSSPGKTTRSAAFANQPVVVAQDAGGNLVTTSSASVTLALTTPGGAKLTCTANPTSAVAGVARFAECRVSLEGSYTLVATSGRLLSATSSPFTIG